ALHSFPTRRSSDLNVYLAAAGERVQRNTGITRTTDGRPHEPARVQSAAGRAITKHIADRSLGTRSGDLVQRPLDTEAERIGQREIGRAHVHEHLIRGSIPLPNKR